MDATLEPPWIAYPSVPPGDFFWREAGESYWYAWITAWNELGMETRAAWLEQPDVPEDWRYYLNHYQEWDAELARIDAEDIAAGILQPNGTPWPKPTQPRSWLGRFADYLWGRR